MMFCHHIIMTNKCSGFFFTIKTRAILSVLTVLFVDHCQLISTHQKNSHSNDVFSITSHHEYNMLHHFLGGFLTIKTRGAKSNIMTMEVRKHDAPGI